MLHIFGNTLYVSILGFNAVACFGYILFLQCMQHFRVVKFEPVVVLNLFSHLLSTLDTMTCHSFLFLHVTPLMCAVRTYVRRLETSYRETIDRTSALKYDAVDGWLNDRGDVIAIKNRQVVAAYYTLTNRLLQFIEPVLVDSVQKDYMVYNRSNYYHCVFNGIVYARNGHVMLRVFSSQQYVLCVHYQNCTRTVRGRVGHVVSCMCGTKNVYTLNGTSVVLPSDQIIPVETIGTSDDVDKHAHNQGERPDLLEFLQIQWCDSGEYCTAILFRNGNYVRSNHHTQENTEGALEVGTSCRNLNELDKCIAT